MIALGKKLFLSLFDLVLSELYRRPNCSRSNRWLLGWEESLMMLPALLRYRELAMSPRLGREQPVIFWAVLMTLSSALLFAAEHPAYHAAMQYPRMLSMVAL